MHATGVARSTQPPPAFLTELCDERDNFRRRRHRALTQLNNFVLIDDFEILHLAPIQVNESIGHNTEWNARVVVWLLDRQVAQRAQERKFISRGVSAVAQQGLNALKQSKRGVVRGSVRGSNLYGSVTCANRPPAFEAAMRQNPGAAGSLDGITELVASIGARRFRS